MLTWSRPQGKSRKKKISDFERQLFTRLIPQLFVMKPFGILWLVINTLAKSVGVAFHAIRTRDKVYVRVTSVFPRLRLHLWFSDKAHSHSGAVWHTSKGAPGWSLQVDRERSLCSPWILTSRKLVASTWHTATPSPSNSYKEAFGLLVLSLRKHTLDFSPGTEGLGAPLWWPIMFLSNGRHKKSLILCLP